MGNFPCNFYTAKNEQQNYMKKVLNQHSKKGVMFNIAALLCVLSTFLLANAVYAADVAVDALPTNGQVVAGDAHIATAGTAAAPVLNVNAGNSQVLSGDRVDVYATGTYNDENVGTAKSIVVDVSLSTPSNLINDAANYSLSSTRVTGNLGTITQLGSVTYTGPSGGNWANPSNWTTTGTNVTGATPTFSFAANMPNVANVIIPVGSSVVYDSASVGNSGSAINNSGTITFNGANNFTWTDNVSGTGGVNLTGVGRLTLAGNNSYSGATNIHASSLVIGSVNALGSAMVISNGGHLSMANNITAMNLTVNGNVSLLSDIRTSGAQIYNGDVLIGGATGMGATPITLTAGNIQFMGTLMSGSIGTHTNGAMGNYQSLVINAGNGQVEFGDRVGSDISDPYRPGFTLSYLSVWRNPLYMRNLYSLVVNAGVTLVKGDITTFEAQTYNTNVLIGDNGNNGLTRTFLSEDPTITFNGTVDDTQVNTHTLVVKAVSISGNANELPVISINDAIGATKALARLEVSTGSQDTLDDFSNIWVGHNQYNGKINIAADVTTVGDQIYTANAILIGDANAASPTLNVIDMTSQSGSVIYNTGTNTSDPSYVPGLQGVGSGATVNVTAANGVVTGEDNPSQLSVNAYDSLSGINNQANQSSDRYSAALFMSESKRHLEVAKLEKSASVTVGEAGVVENGEVHSFNDIKPCAKDKNKNDKECAANKE